MTPRSPTDFFKLFSEFRPWCSLRLFLAFFGHRRLGQEKRTAHRHGILDSPRNREDPAERRQRRYTQWSRNDVRLFTQSKWAFTRFQ